MTDHTNKTRLAVVPFSDIRIDDPFFDSLKSDYEGFPEWFAKKSIQGETAFVLMTLQENIKAFLYTKIENGVVDDVVPILPEKKRLKVGTFKVDAHNTKLGERFIKRIVDVAIVEKVEEVYLTIFPKYFALIQLLEKYGFIPKGNKGDELVLVKSLENIVGDQLKDYPLIPLKGNRKFLLSIYPIFHTRLFPDSILHNEGKDRYKLIKDVSYTNSIHKIYVAYMRGLQDLTPGDLVVIYRTTDKEGFAEYRSVVTSVCRIEEIKTSRDFSSIEDYLCYANTYSVFEEPQLVQLFNSQKNLVIIKMTYNAALKKRVIRKDLIEKVAIRRDAYFGFLELTDDQFNEILRLGGINENIIID